MKIKIVVTKEMLDENIEIVVMGMDCYQEFEIEDCVNETDLLEKRTSKAGKAILQAFQSIFTEERYQELHVYHNIEGQSYTHPGDVAKVANDLIDMENAQDDEEEEGQQSRRKRLTSAGVGRYMKFNLGLVSGERKATGIAYYWNDNKDLVNGLLRSISEHPNDQHEEDDKEVDEHAGSGKLGGWGRI